MRTKIKNIIITSTAKGGVGKTLFSCLIALSLKKKGYRVAMVDTDLMGPSLPNMLNLTGKLGGGPVEGILPPRTVDDIPVFSNEELMNVKSTCVMWRDDRIDSFISNTLEHLNFGGDIDYLIIDSPPSTGCPPQAVIGFARKNRIKHGFVLISEPYKVSLNSTSKAVSMVHNTKAPLIGVVENKLNGMSRITQFCKEQRVPYLGSIPYIHELPQLCDDGLRISSIPESVSSYIEPIIHRILLFYEEG
jgi:Mrp family chromosome partitioning ATPase